MTDKRKFDLRDLLLVVGGCLAGYGIWQVHPPSMYIVAGLVLSIVALRG